MKQLYRKLGLLLLRWSGWNVPTQIVRRISEPIVLEYKYNVPEGTSAFVVESHQRNAIRRLQMKIGEYTWFDVKRSSDGSHDITAILIVQRPDPKGSGEKFTTKVPPSELSQQVHSHPSEGQMDSQSV